MDKKQLTTYLISKPEAELDYPFGPDAAVFKVKGKMFALLFFREGQDQVNLKCDPKEAFILRDIFDAVQPGYHMNKTHWNSVILDQSIPAGEIQRMVDQSYALVVQGLKKVQREAMELSYGKESLYMNSKDVKDS